MIDCLSLLHEPITFSSLVLIANICVCVWMWSWFPQWIGPKSSSNCTVLIADICVCVWMSSWIPQWIAPKSSPSLSFAVLEERKRRVLSYFEQNEWEKESCADHFVQTYLFWYTLIPLYDLDHSVSEKR